MNWRAQAACFGLDPELFFPMGSAPTAEEQIDQARLFCQACPVQDACLNWALTAGVDHGVWGGLTPQERRARRSRRDIRTPASSPPSLGVRFQLHR